MSGSKSKKVIAIGILIMSMTMACNSALSPILAEIGKFSQMQVIHLYRQYYS